MAFLNRLFLIFTLFFPLISFSQEEDKTSGYVQSERVSKEDSVSEQELEEAYIDEESKIIELEDQSLKPYIEYSQSLLNYIHILQDRDSLMYNFVILKGNKEVIPILETGSLILLDRKFNIAFHPNTNKVMYVKEMVLNENQAWDFVYERVFDEDGLTRIFIRRYSTFNSACAELAYEVSEYFLDSNGNTIKKTYELFDSKNNVLDIDECWLEREEYNKERNFSELNQKYNFPLSEINTKLNNEKNDVLEKDKERVVQD